MQPQTHHLASLATIPAGITPREASEPGRYRNVRRVVIAAFFGVAALGVIGYLGAEGDNGPTPTANAAAATIPNATQSVTAVPSGVRIATVTNPKRGINIGRAVSLGPEGTKPDSPEGTKPDSPDGTKPNSAVTNRLPIDP